HQDVANAIQTAFGVSIDKRKIEFPENIKALGQYNIKIKLSEGIQTELKLKVSKSS
ncbi:MAG: 50S ribosomal protein L9, partial [Leptospiraceae bacterium]|nr:50S ribosomal protein L9 [Leptospiraceae bacterium]